MKVFFRTGGRKGGREVKREGGREVERAGKSGAGAKYNLP